MKWETRRSSGNVEDRRGLGRGPVIDGELGIGAVILAISRTSWASPTK
jgi:predicted metalloprotease